MSGGSGVTAVSAAWSSGSKIDSTNPVSIQEAIDQVDKHQNQVRVQLFRLLQRLANQPGEGLDEALGQLAAHTDKVIAESPEASILPHIGTYRDIVARIRELSADISRKHAEEDIQKQVQEFEERLEAGSLSDAAYACVRLAKMAADAEEELAEKEEAQQQEAASGEVAEGTGTAAAATGQAGSGDSAAPRVNPESVALLQETAERCAERLKEALDACCEEAVAVDTDNRSLVVRAVLRNGTARVADLFAALQVLGLQEAYLRRMTDRLVSGALQPMLNAPCCITVTGPDEPGQAASLTWQPPPPGAELPPRPGTTLTERRSGGAGVACDPEHCCQHLLRLLATWLLEFDEGLMEIFGGPFWRAAADCYIAHVARPFITANPEDLEGCEAMVAAAADLEAMAESLNFTNGEDPYLAPAVESLARHALSSCQEKYLQRARQLLVGPGAVEAGGADAAPSWDTVVAGQPLQLDEEYYRRLAGGELQDWEAQDPPCGCRTDGPLTSCGRYLITARCNQLVQLMTGLLEDACAGSRAVSRALLSAASSIALMARSLPPLAASFPEQLLSVPQLGLLAVNDLQHLAAMLLLLSQVYGAGLEGASGENAVEALLGEALALRAAARGSMREQLQHQYSSLDEVLAGLDGLRHVDASDAKVGMRHRRVVQQLLLWLGRLGRVASEVLTPEDGVGLAAAVLNHLAGHLTSAVLAKSDMGHDECSELAALLGPLAKGAVESWLSAARGVGKELSGIPLDVVASAITARSHQLRKLRCVLQVLASDTISAISAAWDRGDLSAMVPSELEHLLFAISEDTPGRRAMLQKLQ